MQRNPDRLASLHNGLEFHPLEIKVTHFQPVELGPSARVEQGHEEGIVLGWNSSKTFSDEGLSLRCLQSPSKNVRSERRPFHRFRLARQSDGLEPREQVKELRILCSLCPHPVERDDVTQVAANRGPRDS